MKHEQKSLFVTFEQEFGRPLSPMEFWQLLNWAAEYREDLIMQALTEAVIASKRNFRYIDRILLNWKKENIKTRREAIEYSKRFRLHTLGSMRHMVQENVADTAERTYPKSIFYNWLEEEM